VDEFHSFLLDAATELVMRPREAATIALWASGVTPGASAFDAPGANPPGVSEPCGAAGTVSGVSSIWGTLVEVVELVVVLSVLAAASGSLAFSVMFGRDVEAATGTRWIGASVVLVVVVLVVVAAGG
jgi:hypothetical protein